MSLALPLSLYSCTIKLKNQKGGRGEEYFILIKGKSHQDDVLNSDIHSPNAKEPTFIKEAETLLKLKSHIEPHTIIVGDFNIQISPIDNTETSESSHSCGN